MLNALKHQQIIGALDLAKPDQTSLRSLEAFSTDYIKMKSVLQYHETCFEDGFRSFNKETKKIATVQQLGKVKHNHLLIFNVHMRKILTITFLLVEKLQ